MSGTTLFEKIITGEVPSHKVGQGEGWYAFLDIFPRRLGHTLVIPEVPVTNLSQLNASQFTNLFTGMREVQQLLSRFFDTDDFTICIHDGPLAGQEVPHTHIHIIPRTTDDGGLTLMSMWPNTKSSTEIDHHSLSKISQGIRGD